MKSWNLLFWCCLPLLLIAQERKATPPSLISIRDGFTVELLRSAGEGEGSWISMTFDDQGHLFVALDRVGIGRITLGKEGSEIFTVVENSLKHCRGILYAHGSLYANSTNSKGFYRLKDEDGDGVFEGKELLKSFPYDSRYGHGQNQLKLGPDGKLYLVFGNDCDFPEGTSPKSAYRNPQNDWLLPNPNDAGHDNRVGYILRMDKDGKSWEVLAGGLRNQVDIAFNREGEIFTWDADMEWDVGLPWYRPTRVNHIVSGGEYGWRWGTGKWPDWQPEALPSNLDTGLGSPTGLVFGHEGNFPEPWASQLFLAEWQNGKIYSATAKSVGASYRLTYESFLEGAPLNVADMEFGPDGHLYFITGGRNSQSGLYRVRFTGGRPPDVGPEPEHRITVEARKIRRQLETYHTTKDPEAISKAWPHLSSEDLWIRFAARIAVENQDLSLWRQKALAQPNPTALLALARSGETDLEAWLNGFDQLPLSKLSQTDQLFALRALSLAFIRIGEPCDSQKAKILKQLEPLFPVPEIQLNRMLVELLIYLESSNVPEGTLQYLQSTPTQEEQIHVAMSLLHAQPASWSVDQWKQMLTWLNQSKRYRGGHKFGQVLKSLREDYLKMLPEAHASDLSTLVAEVKKPDPLAVITAPVGKFVKAWKMEDFQKEFNQDLSNRDLHNGRRAAASTMCLVCHRIGAEGGQVGPDLTQVGGRFGNRELLESILHPSAVMDPKYQPTQYELKNGEVISGTTAGVNARTLKIETNPFSHETVTIQRSEIRSSQVSKISPMPAGLIHTLTKKDILDLLAYLKQADQP